MWKYNVFMNIFRILHRMLLLMLLLMLLIVFMLSVFTSIVNAQMNNSQAHISNTHMQVDIQQAPNPEGVGDLPVLLKQIVDSTYTKQPQPLNEKQRQLQEFYKLRDYTPVWISAQGWSDAASQALETLKNADQEGLTPSDYQGAEALMKQSFSDIISFLKAEIDFSKIVLNYIDDLFGERLHPRRISRELYLNPDPVNAAEILQALLQADPKATSLKTLTVQKPQYQALKKLLQTYRDGHGSQPLLPLIPKGRVLKKGDKDARVLTLRQQLADRGYLESSQATGHEFDHIVETALKHFQKDHHLEADGKLGERTVAILNKNKQDYIHQIIVSMERWRWLPRNMGNRYVLVNIAAFQLQAWEDGKKVLDMPVIIGRNYRHTPVFSSLIDAVRFNPTWHVPRSIAIRDKLPKLKKDPSSLARSGYVVYDNSGRALSPEAIDWTTVDASNFHYHLTQRPGPQNALGKIRFHLYNPFGIYLHATPDQDLFKKSVRNFSSGCIRVAEPVQLAAFVFNDPEKWPPDKIKAAMEGTKTRNVLIKNPVPVYIAYFTVWIDEEGKPHFYDDIYGQDAFIWKALNKRTAHN